MARYPITLNQDFKIVYYLRHFFSAAVLLLMAACSNSSNSNQPGQGMRRGGGPRAQKTSVETIAVKRSNIAQQVKSYGNIRAQDVVQVNPQISNRITHIYVHLGDTVRQGDPMAKIYDATYEDALNQAKAQLEQRETALKRDSLQFQRQQKLYKRELISATEFENARATFLNSKAAYQEAKASLTQSRENLKNTIIRSPVYGVVLQRNMAEGDLATTGQAIFEVANLTGYQTRLYLPLQDWNRVRVGQPVQMSVSNSDNAAARGRVLRKSPQIDPTTGLGEVVISLTSSGPSIHQGVLVKASINIEEHDNAVVIPRTALVENVQTLIEPESNTIQLQRSYSAFVVNDDSLAVRRKLKLGIEQGDQIEVLEGLQPDDQLVITGQNGLDDSTSVRIANVDRFTSPQRRTIDTATSDSSNSGDQSL